MKLRVIQDFKPDKNFKKNEEYQVYAISIENTGSLTVLIEWGQYYGKYGKPQWFSIEDFEVIDSRVPYNWMIEICTVENYRSQEFPDWGIQIIRNGMMMGYDRLVKDLGHEAGLLERNQEDLDYFYKNIHNQIDTID